MTEFLLDGQGLPPVLLAGLTGGIGTGKSTVAGMLREAGLPVVDADAIVRRLLDAGGDAVDPVANAFGRKVIGPDGGVDRAALADLVFRDDRLRRRLEEIVHPLVVGDSLARIREWANVPGTEVVIYDAALLVETGRHRQFHRLIVVATRPEIQLQRVMARDGLAPDQAGARIRSQMPLAQKSALADYLIDNSGHWQETRRQVAAVLADLREDARLLRSGRPLPIRRVVPM